MLVSGLALAAVQAGTVAVRDLLNYGTTPADQVRRLLPRSAVRVAVRGLLEALGHPQHAVLAQGGRAVVG